MQSSLLLVFTACVWNEIPRSLMLLSPFACFIPHMPTIATIINTTILILLYMYSSVVHNVLLTTLCKFKEDGANVWWSDTDFLQDVQWHQRYFTADEVTSSTV